jgi:hypothetical protein
MLPSRYSKLIAFDEPFMLRQAGAPRPATMGTSVLFRNSDSTGRHVLAIRGKALL